MKGPIVNIAQAIGDLVGKFTLPAREKRELEAELTKLMMELEDRFVEEQAAVLREEAKGNWLQRSWRPVLMLAFAAIILVGAFVELPILADSSRFWDLLEIGIGGYIIGKFRSY